MSAGLLTVVGQCCGAGEEKQAKEYAWLFVAINYVLLAFLCTAMFLGCRSIVGWYHLSPEAAGLTEGLIRAHTWAMIIWPVAFLFPNYFRATGKAAFTMVIAISSMWIFRVGLAHVFIHVLHMNVLGVWYAMFIDWFFRVVVFTARYCLDNRKENR